MEKSPDFNLFISYSHKDEELVERLKADLGKYDIDVQYDRTLLNAGEDWKKAITLGRSKADGILILFTHNSLNSTNVIMEMGIAQTFANDSKNPKLFIPVIVGDIEIPKAIQDIQVIYWREDYNEVIDRIVKAIYSFRNNEDKRPGSKISENERPDSNIVENEHGGLENGSAGVRRHSYLPFFLTEGNHRSTYDQLGFQNDITSFASVIALKEVDPPLAIGLFGNWGSGKSFFMEKLEEEIEKFAQSKNQDFVKYVVPVKFNSWHYSDTNLWASLTTQIFESLNDYAQKKKYGEEAIKNIYKNLTLTSYQLDETNKRLDANNVQEKILKEKIEDIEETIKKKKEKLNLWNAKDFIRIVFSDPFIQEDFRNIKSQFETENLIENIGQIDQKLSELDSAGGQIVESFLLLRANSKGKWVIVWILAILFGIIGLLALGQLKENIKDYLKALTGISLFVTTWLTALIVKLSPYLKKINQFYKRLKSLKNTIEKEKEKVILNEDLEITKLNKDISDLLTVKADIESEQTKVQERKQMLLNELKEIGSGRLLASFLAGKSLDDAYLKQLGIVSWIRKDFSILNDLFRKQRTVQKRENLRLVEVQIDRIVLYIDDLDRCNEDVVVKVLEAIHLLLAFPLFVVVVGVDPRWLNNALSEKYKTLFGYKTDRKNRNDLNENILTEESETDGILEAGAATSYDYLEKIFQIPFAIKPINKSGRNKLIQYLLRKEMKKDTAAAKSASVFPDSAELNNEQSSNNVESDVSSSEHESNKVLDDSETNQTTITEAKEKLVFNDYELEYMQNISELYGKTPRSINRYVNIYRIIKAHGNLQTDGDSSEEDYMAVMFLLGVIIGYSFFAKEFIEEISRSEDNQYFGDFISGSNDLNKDLLKHLIPFTSEISSITMRKFKQNLELVSRFSFRTLYVES